MSEIALKHTNTQTCWFQSRDYQLSLTSIASLLNKRLLQIQYKQCNIKRWFKQRDLARARSRR